VFEALFVGAETKSALGIGRVSKLSYVIIHRLEKRCNEFPLRTRKFITLHLLNPCLNKSKSLARHRRLSDPRGRLIDSWRAISS
jgi:hypothetical protein